VGLVDDVGIVVAELLDDLLDLLVFTCEDGIAYDLFESGKRMV
jgi:hypothetical protein